jgi:hypothetical protein
MGACSSAQHPGIRTDLEMLFATTSNARQALPRLFPTKFPEKGSYRQLLTAIV